MTPQGAGMLVVQALHHDVRARVPSHLLSGSHTEPVPIRFNHARHTAITGAHDSPQPVVQRKRRARRTSCVTVTEADLEHVAEWVAARGPALQRFAYLVTGSADDAPDLVQEALARALPRWRSLTARGTAEAYVRRSIVNASISAWRKSGRQQPSGDPEPAVGRRRQPDPCGRGPRVGAVRAAARPNSEPRSSCASTRTCRTPRSAGCWAARSRPPAPTSTAPWPRSGTHLTSEHRTREEVRVVTDDRAEQAFRTALATRAAGYQRGGPRGSRRAPPPSLARRARGRRPGASPSSSPGSRSGPTAPRDHAWPTVLPSGWRWESHANVMVAVPATWGYAAAPGQRLRAPRTGPKNVRSRDRDTSTPVPRVRASSPCLCAWHSPSSRSLRHT